MYRASHRAERSPREMDTFRPVAGNSGSLAAHISQVEGAPGPDQGPSPAVAWLIGLAGALVVIVVGAGAFMNAQQDVSPLARASSISGPAARPAFAPPKAAAPIAAPSAAPIAAPIPAAVPTITAEVVKDPPIATSAKKKIRKRVRTTASPAPAPETAPATPTEAAPTTKPTPTKASTPASASAAAKIKAQEDLIRASAETPIN